MQTLIRAPKYNRFLGLWDSRITTIERSLFTGKPRIIAASEIRANTEQECFEATMVAANRQAREYGVSFAEFE